MKAIYSVFFYISLAIALCSPNVSTFCGNNEQIDDLQTALIIYESTYDVMSTLSAIPLTSVALTIVQVTSAGQFAMRLKEAFEEMESSLNKDHKDYRKCSEILGKNSSSNHSHQVS
ncbi:unnamed protein product [Macrosiphum euphorbiae]|uniref:Uncharacterized protein n=1 Tax=Macrosiphum euphorbiae TaxID=13131 RepID=A0AAV0XZS8_9HEMI|nr:unnamed protein product [Macrosiphum euphorbiae]